MKTNLNRETVAQILALTLVLVLLPASQAYGRPSPRLHTQLNKIYATSPPNIFRHNVGLLDLMITNIGVIGNPEFVSQNAASWRGGEYLYAAALWIGAIANDNLPYVSTGIAGYEYEFRPSLEAVDTIYPSYEGASNGNRLGFSMQPDDDNDGQIDEDPLNGKDDDGDGKIDEDYSATSQQMYACEYWDNTPEAMAQFPEHRPLGIKVHQESYAWSTAGANEFVGFDFKIKNQGSELLRMVYIGFFVDSDVGPKSAPNFHTDDRGQYFAIDTTFVDPSISYDCQDRITQATVKCSEQKLKMDICAMWDVTDDGVSAKGGDVDGYFGGMFLGHTTDPFGEIAPKTVKIVTARFFNGGDAYPAGDPANDSERYDLLQSGAKQTRSTTSPDDYRYCMSTGPFAELAPGQELTLQTAFVIGKGREGMVTNAINAQRIYNGKWTDADGSPETGRDGRETCLRALSPSEPLVWRDPCDSLRPALITIKETTPCKDVENATKNMVDADCNCCTPLFQNWYEAIMKGNEYLVHWVGTVAPPAPNTNFDRPDTVAAMIAAHDRRVEIKWDNLSELTADPIQRKILFTGYRIWRVEGWSRPVGSAGPAPEEWALVADLSLQPPDGRGENSPFFLDKFTHLVDSLGLVPTGSIIRREAMKQHYKIGRYAYSDTTGLKNGMVYFYDVTAYSAWDAVEYDENWTRHIRHHELSSRPSARERDGVVPMWNPVEALGDVYVVPNPYIRGQSPDGWDLVPSHADPTGSKIAFVGLPRDSDCDIKIYTLSGDVVRTLHHNTRTGESAYGKGAAFWDLVSRNGQDVVSGIYLYSVQCGGKSKVGRFVVVR